MDRGRGERTVVRGGPEGAPVRREPDPMAIPPVSAVAVVPGWCCRRRPGAEPRRRRETSAPGWAAHASEAAGREQGSRCRCSGPASAAAAATSAEGARAGAEAAGREQGSRCRCSGPASAAAAGPLWAVVPQDLESRAGSPGRGPAAGVQERDGPDPVLCEPGPGLCGARRRISPAIRSAKRGSSPSTRARVLSTSERAAGSPSARASRVKGETPASLSRARTVSHISATSRSSGDRPPPRRRNRTTTSRRTAARRRGSIGTSRVDAG